MYVGLALKDNAHLRHNGQSQEHRITFRLRPDRHIWFFQRHIGTSIGRQICNLTRTALKTRP